MTTSATVPETMWHFSYGSEITRSVDFSADGLHHVSVHCGGFLKVVDVASMQLRDSYHQEWEQAAFTLSTDVVALTSSRSTDHHIYLLSLTSGAIFASIGGGCNGMEQRQPPSRSPPPAAAQKLKNDRHLDRRGPISCISQCRASDIIAACEVTSNRLLILHPNVSGQPLAATATNALPSRPTSLSYSEDGVAIAVGMPTGVMVFDLRKLAGGPVTQYQSAKLFKKPALGFANECVGVSLSTSGILVATSNFGEVVAAVSGARDISGPRCTYYHGHAAASYVADVPSVCCAAALLRPWDRKSPILHQGSAALSPSKRPLLIYDGFAEDDVLPDEEVHEGLLRYKVVPHTNTPAPANSIAVNRRLAMFSVAGTGFTWWSAGVSDLL